MKFPKLYKLTSTGKIQIWEISTEDNIIVVVQGQQDGKKQRYEETISEGKNIGKGNETSPSQQAEAQAKSKWEKKHNKDYHLTVDKCNVTTKIANLGGYLPMLAHSYKKHADKHLKYPCICQPKLDGIRCTTTKKDDKIKLWFRSGKEIITMNHIATDLNQVMKNGDIVDGELYIHGKDFNSFTGAIRASKKLKTEIINKIQYHVYDFPRIKNLTELDSFYERYNSFNPVNLPLASVIKVETIVVNNFEEAMDYYKRCIEAGYEGIMFRNINMPYEQKRSYSLLKYKEFIDDEFIIIGKLEGKGSLAGHVGSFICKLEEGRVLKDMNEKTKIYHKALDKRPDKDKGTVKAKMKGKTSYLKHLFTHPEEYMGKPLTIIYQNLSEYCVPRFPVAKSIRFDK